MDHSSSVTDFRIARDVPAARPRSGHFIMAVLLLALGYFLIWPVILLLINSFNAATDWFVEPRVWGLRHWQNAFLRPGLLRSLGNSLLIWSLTVVFSFPIGIAIAWILARSKIPFSRTLEFMFWISYMVPALPTTIAWIMLLDPDIGMINVALKNIFHLDQGPFNIFSVPGIVWANLMGHSIAIKVMLLTPAFRNMDCTLEEAARVSGASNLRTLFKVTLPLMISPMVLVFALQLLRIFQSFETEYLLGLPFGFFVYSTKIFTLIRDPVPNYGEATVLASITLLMIVMIVPVQRWILERRRYATITGSFRPGLIDLGRWNTLGFILIALLLVLLTVGPLSVLVLGVCRSNQNMPVLGGTKTITRDEIIDPEPNVKEIFFAQLILRQAPREFHDPNWLLRSRLHARQLEIGHNGSGFPEGAAHDVGPRHHGSDCESAVVFGHCLYHRAHALAGSKRARSDGLVFRGDPRHSRRPRAPVVVRRYTAAQFPFRHYLGVDHRRDPPGQYHRGQHHERRASPGRRGHGRGGTRFRGRMDQDLLQDLAAVAHA